MNSPQEHHGEQQPREGLGGRVRHFVKTELGLDQNQASETRSGHPENPDPAPRPARQTAPVHHPDQITSDEPIHRRTGPFGPPAAPGPDVAEGEPRLQPTQPEAFRDQSGDRLAADPDATRVELLNDAAGLREQWQRIQGTFVDDPRRAVHEASALVNRTLDEIRANVGSPHPSETTSTDELRASFRRYREFFQRLLSA